MGRLCRSFECGVSGRGEEEDSFCQVCIDAKFGGYRAIVLTHRRVGPVSSLHDRACELFYTIKGGTGD